MATDIIRGDRNYQGFVTYSGGMSFPDAVIGNDQVSPADPITADKLFHRHAIRYAQVNGADVTAKTEVIHVARGAGEILSVEVRPSVIPAAGDKATQIDVQKSADGSASWTTILTATIDFTQASTAHTLKVGTVAGPATYAAGDAFRVVVAVTGTTGTQMQGFGLTLNLDEEPA